MIDAVAAGTLTRAIGWALVEFVWQGALVGALTALALAAARRSAARLRYALACTGLLVMAVLPVAGIFQRAHDAPASAPLLAFERLTVVPTSSETVSSSPVEAEPLSSRANGLTRFSPLRRTVDAWLPTILAVWLAGVVALAMRLAAGWMLVERLRRSHTRPAPEPWRAYVDAVAVRLRISRPIRILESSLVRVPTVIGAMRPVVLLPASILTGLSTAQLEVVIAHEIAHIRRHDYVVNLLQTAAETLLFYHPAVWWVSHRIRIEREFCCDDVAVSLCGDRIGYARALVDLEASRHTGVLAIAATGGSLKDRIKRLLGDPGRHESHLPAWLGVGAAFLVVLLILGNRPAWAPAGQPASREIDSVAPNLDSGRAETRSLRSGMESARAALQAVRFAEQPLRRELDRLGLGGGEHQASWSQVGERFEVRWSGDVVPTNTDDDIALLSPDGFLVISETSWLRADRRLEFRSRADGSIDRRFFSRGQPAAYDADGAAWSREVLLTVLRRTGVGAEARIDRFLAAGGVPALLFEISHFESDYSRAIYFARLLEVSPLRDAEIAATLHQAAASISSDYQMATLLIGAPDRAVAEENARREYFAAIETIDSDYERRRTLSSLVDCPRLPVEALRQSLTSARTLGSDYELAELLIQSADLMLAEPSAATGYFDATASIGSDYELCRVLTAVVSRPGVPPGVVVQSLRAAGRIGSDYEMAELLTTLAETAVVRDRSVRAALLDTMDRIGSDYERDRVRRTVDRSLAN